VVLLWATISVVSCQRNDHVEQLSEHSFVALNDSFYVINEAKIRSDLKHIAAADTDRCDFDKFVRSYYLRGNKPLWITFLGVGNGADSLLNSLREIEKVGLSQEKFRYSQLRNDLETIRKLNFSEGDNNINKVYARAEYHLTKSFMRYCIGMRFGFVRPNAVLNRLDIDDSDTTKTTYIRLFDIPIETPSADDYAAVVARIGSEEVGKCLRESAPTASLYDKLASLYSKNKPLEARKRLLCNMERARWRLKDYPDDHKKKVVVNLPSQHLMALDGENVLSMRIGCGAFDTKTPLLTSSINRLDFNPQWVIPKSIILKNIVPHAGDVEYFERNNYYVAEKKTGTHIDVGSVTAEMLRSGDYRVIQRGGEGNSLGRVIFRFDNDFSVFMHDTSSPDVFERVNRSVSHGCIRVQQPYDLAVFMLEDKDAETIDKIDYTMREWHSAKPQTDAESDVMGTEKHDKERYKYDKESLKYDKKRYIRSLNVEPNVPLFITYYTMYPDENNVIRSYNDIYGYDEVIFSHLKPFLQ